MRRSGRALAWATAMLLASGAATACGADGGSEAGGDATTSVPAGTTGPAASPSGAAKPSSTARRGPLTLAELVRRPCLALDDEDVRSASLRIFTDGTETDYGDKSCQWGAGGGLVSFTPYASKDETKAAEFSHLAGKNISGSRALLGSVMDHGRAMFVLLVSVGANQSFRLDVLPGEENAPGPDGPTLATDFAKAILANLR
ncbi:DUF3558 family protein [Streptomyces swartbergensis]|uniref:DUF3558 family protein n=1 Tax=Streptomyces swartbergensis TaxID=487165 RepID=UPI00382FD7C0